MSLILTQASANSEKILQPKRLDEGDLRCQEFVRRIGIRDLVELIGLPAMHNVGLSRLI